MSAPSYSQPTATPDWPAPHYVKGLALGIPIYLVAIHLWTWLLVVPASLRTTGYDFRQIYAAAFMVRTGHASELYVYDAQKRFQDAVVSPQPRALPFVSPAYEALLLSPLTFLRFRTAYFVYLAVNVTALSICFGLLWPSMRNLRSVFSWLPIAIFLGFLPIAAALIEGQDSVLLTTLLVGAYALLTNERSFAAGILTGLGFFKFPIVLPIALLFLIWRRWSYSMGLAISAGAAACMSVWLVGIPQSRLYVDSLMSIAGIKPPTSGLALYPVNWRMMANLHGLTFGLASDRFPPSVLHAITILLSAVVLGWTAVRGLRVADDSSLLLVAIPCSVLVAHHTYIHDLSVLLLPIVVLMNIFLPAEATGDFGQRRIGRSAVLMFVAPVLESFFPRHFYFVGLALIFFLLASTSAASRAARAQTS